MPNKKQKNTNGFPVNGGFPDWIKIQKCSNCGEKTITAKHYETVGFHMNGDLQGRLFVTFTCPCCNAKGKTNFGDDEEFSLERLCTLVIQESKVLKVAEKEIWERKHS